MQDLPVALGEVTFGCGTGLNFPTIQSDPRIKAMFDKTQTVVDRLQPRFEPANDDDHGEQDVEKRSIRLGEKR